MKKYFLLITLFISASTFAQNATYILIRHAEKDTTAKGSTTMQANPQLSSMGQERAKRLITALHEYSLDEIYSTNFIRTKSTALPIAEVSKKEIQLYDHKNLKAFADNLLLQNNKTILVVGHNTTTPGLANLLLKESKYSSLDESVYNKIFIVTIQNNIASCKVLEY